MCTFYCPIISRNYKFSTRVFSSWTRKWETNTQLANQLKLLQLLFWLNLTLHYRQILEKIYQKKVSLDNDLHSLRWHHVWFWVARYMGVEVAIARSTLLVSMARFEDSFCQLLCNSVANNSWGLIERTVRM